MGWLTEYLRRVVPIKVALLCLVLVVIVALSAVTYLLAQRLATGQPLSTRSLATSDSPASHPGPYSCEASAERLKKVREDLLRLYWDTHGCPEFPGSDSPPACHILLRLLNEHDAQQQFLASLCARCPLPTTTPPFRVTTGPPIALPTSATQCLPTGATRETAYGCSNPAYPDGNPCCAPNTCRVIGINNPGGPNPTYDISCDPFDISTCPGIGGVPGRFCGRICTGDQCTTFPPCPEGFSCRLFPGQTFGACANPLCPRPTATPTPPYPYRSPTETPTQVQARIERAVQDLLARYPGLTREALDQVPSSVRSDFGLN